MTPGLVTPAAAQNNSLVDPSAVENAMLNGVTLDQLSRVARSLKVNGQPMSVAQNSTPEGAKFLVLTTGQGGVRIVVGGLGKMGDEDKYAAYQLFTVLGDVVPTDPAFVHDFNRRVKHSKLIKAAGSSNILVTEALAIGGVTEQNIVANFARMFYGLDKLGEAIAQSRNLTRNQVSFDPDAAGAAPAHSATSLMDLSGQYTKTISFRAVLPDVTGGIDHAKILNHHEPAEVVYDEVGLIEEIIDKASF